MTDLHDLAARIRYVLVRTSHPGNIGSAARAIRTMGFTRLALVSPHRFPDPEAHALAAGADDVLANAGIHAPSPTRRPPTWWTGWPAAAWRWACRRAGAG